MKKAILILALAALMSSCITMRSCPTYSYRTKNLSTGDVTVNYSDVLYYPGDIVCQLPDKTKFEILEVTLTQSHYKPKTYGN